MQSSRVKTNTSGLFPIQHPSLTDSVSQKGCRCLSSGDLNSQQIFFFQCWFITYIAMGEVKVMSYVVILKMDLIFHSHYSRLIHHLRFIVYIHIIHPHGTNKKLARLQKYSPIFTSVQIKMFFIHALVFIYQNFANTLQ